MLASRETDMADDLEFLRPGMQVQLARRRDAIAQGMAPRGWKIGLNVAAVQAHFGLQGACVGWLDGRRRPTSIHSARCRSRDGLDRDLRRAA